MTTDVAKVRLTCLTAFPAYNQRNYNVSIHLRAISDGTYHTLRFSGQGFAVHNAFNPNMFSDPSSVVYFGDADSGPANAPDSKWDLPLGYTQTLAVYATTDWGTVGSTALHDGMRCGWLLKVLTVNGQLRVELLDASDGVMASYDYDSSTEVLGLRINPSTGDAYDVALTGPPAPPPVFWTNFVKSHELP